MITIVNGDLLKSDATYICHQVNCMGVMGGGVALQIRNQHPRVYEVYKKYCDDHAEARESMLGNAQGVRVSDKRIIVNLFGQCGYGVGMVQTDLPKLRQACHTLVKNIPAGSTIAMPYRIGAGLAGGDWGKIMDMLAEVFSGHNLVLYRFMPKQ